MQMWTKVTMTGLWIFYLLATVAYGHSEKFKLEINSEISVKITEELLTEFYKCLCKESNYTCTVKYNRDLPFSSDRSASEIEEKCNSKSSHVSRSVFICTRNEEGYVYDLLICTRRSQSTCFNNEKYQILYMEEGSDCGSRCVLISGATVKIPGNDNTNLKTCDVTCSGSNDTFNFTSWSSTCIRSNSNAHTITYNYETTTTSTYSTEESTSSEDKHSTDNVTGSICDNMCNDTSTPVPKSNSSTSDEMTKTPSDSHGEKEEKSNETTIIIAIVISCVVVIAVILVSLIACRRKKLSRKEEEGDNGTQQERVGLDTFYVNDTESISSPDNEASCQVYSLPTSNALSKNEREINTLQDGDNKQDKGSSCFRTTSVNQVGDAVRNEYEYEEPSENLLLAEYSGLHEQARHFQNPYNTAPYPHQDGDSKHEPSSIRQPNDEQIIEKEMPSETAHSVYSGLHEQTRNFQNPYNDVPCPQRDANMNPDPSVLQQSSNFEHN